VEVDSSDSGSDGTGEAFALAEDRRVEGFGSSPEFSPFGAISLFFAGGLSSAGSASLPLGFEDPFFLDDTFAVEALEEDRFDAVGEFTSESVVSSFLVVPLFFDATSGLGVSSSSTFEPAPFFLTEDGLGLDEPLGVDLAVGVSFAVAAGFGVAFPDCAAPDFFPVSAPAAIRAQLRSRVMQTRAF